MKILVINPNTSAEMTRGILQSALEAKQPSTEITCVNPPHGPECIEGTADEMIAAYQLIEILKQYEAQGGYDAYIVACFGDPGLDALRELTDKPVVGVAESAIHLSAFISGKFSIVSILPRVRRHLEELVHRCGAESRLASLKTPNLAALAFHEDGDAAKKALLEASRQAVKEDYAELIILGCAGMSGLASDVSAAIGVPVLDSVTCAVKVAEGLVDMGLKTSKSNTYAYPTKKQYN